MNPRKRLQALALCAAAAFASLSAIPVARAARAVGDDEPRRQVNVLPPVSLAEGQTLRLNLLNTGRSPLEIIPCIFDADGAHLKTWETVTLLPGQTRSFELNRAEAGRRGDGSVRVRAGVHADESRLRYLLVSGEVVEDATGRSSLFVPGARVGFDPQPDPPAGR
jgi:hypothetical protein